ncbi:MAG: hypothetical protein V4641_12995 [Pseudomonadota bacterium]
MGIDPGIHGAIACIHGAGVEVFDTPVFNIKGKDKPDLHGLHGLISRLAAIHEPSQCVIEDVHSMPKQGVASSFTFGHVAGATQMAVVAAGIPLRMVPPASWKRLMGLGRDKDESRRRASQLYPAFAHLWPLKKHDGRAEAVLLAHYGRLTCS